jgi:hypothetical protein
MGVDLRASEILLRLQRQGQITGQRIVTLGRQSIDAIMPDEICSKSESYLETILLNLGASEAESIDVSPYEGASIIHDMQSSLPVNLRNRFDLVLDFGVSEHILDIGTVFSNIDALLKKGGLYVGILPRTGWNDHGLFQFTPEFFFTLARWQGYSLECACVAVDEPEARYYQYQTYGRDPLHLQSVLMQRTYMVVTMRKLRVNIERFSTASSVRYQESLHQHSGVAVADIREISTTDFIAHPFPAAKISRTALIHIATGPYTQFTKQFVSSAVHGFDPTNEKTVFILSDDIRAIHEKQLFTDINSRIYPIEHIRWPYITLLRYKLITAIASALLAEKPDYIYFANANAVFIDSDPSRQLMDSGKEICLVQHPGFYQQPGGGPFERRAESLAALNVKETQDLPYVQGFLFGGKTDAFMELAERLHFNVDQDLRNSVIAQWHDESHLNCYHVRHIREQTLILDPGHAFPEGCNLPFPCRILSRDKSKYLDIDRFKSE